MDTYISLKGIGGTSNWYVVKVYASGATQALIIADCGTNESVANQIRDALNA